MEKESIFTLKTANEVVNEAMNREVTEADISKEYARYETLRRMSFESQYKSKSMRDAHMRGFKEGWDAAILAFGDLCPEFDKWCQKLTVGK